MTTASATLPALLAPLNELLLPLIRAGVAAPLLTVPGFVVLEVAGRRSGRVYSVPLLGWALAGYVVVSTVRAESAWVKNLDAAGTASVWLRGRRRAARLETAYTTPCTGAHVAVLRLSPETETIPGDGDYPRRRRLSPETEAFPEAKVGRD